MARAGNARQNQAEVLEKLLAMPEEQFCSFFNSRLKQYPVVHEDDYVGELCAKNINFVETYDGRPVASATKKKKERNTTGTVSGEESIGKEGPDAEVRDLFPLLYNCIALHAGVEKAKQAMGYFQGIENQYISSMSLDDIEEIATKSL
eukprot:g4290.t1